MKKSFAILAVTLMLLVAIAPVISSTNVNNTNDNKQQSQGIIYKEYYPGAPRADPNVAYYIPDRVLVLFKDFVKVNEIESINVEGNSYQITETIPEANVALVEVTGCDLFEFVEKVEKNDNVECAGLDDIRFFCDGPNDPYYQNGSQWGVEAIKGDKAWNVPRNMELTWLTILDSGIDPDHEDLIGANIYQRDFLDNDNIANDITEMGHGTKVAGIAMARMNNGKGIAGVAGNAPNIEMLKIAGADSSTTVSLIIKALIYCTTRHKPPSVILMALGGYSDNKVERAICHALSVRIGDSSLLIASVGNAKKSDGIYYPAAYSSVISVGAVNETLKLCWYPSNWGSNYNAMVRQVDLVAPGINIVTTTDPDKTGNNYGYFAGTSAAAAFVAGVIMLWYGARATKKGHIFRKNEPNLCRHALYYNAKPLGVESPPNKKYGWGIVDAYASIPHARTMKEKPRVAFINVLIENFPLLEKLLSNFFPRAFLAENFENKVGGLFK